MFEIDKRVGRPQASPEIVPRDHRARVFKQSGQYLERLRLQFNSHTAPSKQALLNIDFERSEPYYTGGTSCTYYNVFGCRICSWTSSGQDPQHFVRVTPRHYVSYS
jgi:hypothetical protein